MKRMNSCIAALILLFTQAGFSAALTLEDLKGDDAPSSDIGWVDSLDKEADAIVIGDRQFFFTSETLYLSIKEEPISKDSFAADMAIRYLAEGNTILTIWHFYDPEDEYRPKSENVEEEEKAVAKKKPEVKAPNDGVMKKVDGVWTN